MTSSSLSPAKAIDQILSIHLYYSSEKDLPVPDSEGEGDIKQLLDLKPCILIAIIDMYERTKTEREQVKSAVMKFGHGRLGAATYSVSLAPQFIRYTVNCASRDSVSHLLTHLVVYIIARCSSLNTTTLCLIRICPVLPDPTYSINKSALDGTKADLPFVLPESPWKFGIDSLRMIKLMLGHGNFTVEPNPRVLNIKNGPWAPIMIVGALLTHPKQIDSFWRTSIATGGCKHESPSYSLPRIRSLARDQKEHERGRKAEL